LDPEDEDLDVDHDDDDKPEPGAPGESHKDETVPKHQFLAALRSANDKYDALQRELQELKAKTTTAAPAKEPTRAELLAAVKENLISQEQADAVWEKQIADRATSQALAGAKQLTANETLSVRVNDQLTSYRELVPDAWVDGSDDRKKVEAEFKHLVSLGHPSTPATEAAAMRAAFGDIAALKLAKNAKPGAKDSHQEVGGGKPDGKHDDAKDPVKGLDARKRAYYEEGIKRGRYKDWAAVREELKFARPRSARA